MTQTSTEIEYRLQLAKAKLDRDEAEAQAERMRARCISSLPDVVTLLILTEWLTELTGLDDPFAAVDALKEGHTVEASESIAHKPATG